MDWYETVPVNHFSVFVERAVMAPDIPKVDPIVIPTWSFAWYSAMNAA